MQENENVLNSTQKLASLRIDTKSVNEGVSPLKMGGSRSPSVRSPSRRSPRLSASTRRMTVENGTEALNMLLDSDSVASAGDMSMSMSMTSVADDRRNTADPSALAAIMATFDAEEVDATCKSISTSVADAAPDSIRSSARRSSSSRRLSATKDMTSGRDSLTSNFGDFGAPNERRQTADMDDMAALMNELDGETNERRITADASDMANLLSDLDGTKHQTTVAPSVATLPAVYTGRDSIESVNTVDLVHQVGHLLAEGNDDLTSGTITGAFPTSTYGEERRLTGLTVDTHEMNQLLDQAGSMEAGRESIDTVDTADLMEQVQAVCREEQQPAPAPAPAVGTLPSPGLLEKLMGDNAMLDDVSATPAPEGAPVQSSRIGRRSSRGSNEGAHPPSDKKKSSKKNAGMSTSPARRSSRRLSGQPAEKVEALKSPEPVELSPLTETLPVYKEPIGHVRGILSSKKAPKSERKSVVFGSPQAVEFKKEEHVTNYTPMQAKEVRSFFSMEPAPSNTDGDDDGDASTAENSAILDEWDRLSNPDEGDASSPMTDVSPSPKRRSPRRKSREHTPAPADDDEDDYVPQEDATGTVQLPGTLTELMDEAANVAVPRTVVPDEEDKTAELEGDLGMMLRQLSNDPSALAAPLSKDTEEAAVVSVTPSLEEIAADGPTVQLESCLTDMLDEVDKPVLPSVPAAVDVDDYTAELEPDLGAVLDMANAEMTRDEEAMAADLNMSVDSQRRRSAVSVDVSVASSQDTAPLSQSPRRFSLNSSRASLGAAVLSPSATPASLLNRLQGLNAAARRTTLSHCETPLAANSRMSIGMKRHAMMTSASRIQNTAKKAKNTALRLSLQGSTLGLDESAVLDDVDVDVNDSVDTAPVDEDAVPVMGRAVTTETEVEVEPAPASEVENVPHVDVEPKAVPALPTVEIEKDDATLVELGDLFELVGLTEGTAMKSNDANVPTLRTTLAAATGTCPEPVAKVLTAAVEDLLLDAVEQFPVQEADEAALASVWSEVDEVVSVRAERALASAKEAIPLKQNASLCRGAAAAKWGEWEAHILENSTRALEEHLEAVRAESARLSADMGEKEAFLVPYTALSSSGLTADSHLSELRERLRGARTDLEDSRSTLLALGDTTSELLERRKDVLVQNLSTAVPDSLELALGSTSTEDSRIAALEGEVDEMAAKVGILGGITWTRVVCITADAIETEHLLADGVAVHVQIALETASDRVSVSVGNVELVVQEETVASNVVLFSEWFFQNVLRSKGHVLCPKHLAAVSTLSHVRTLYKELCGYVSCARNMGVWLHSFTAEGWRWTVQEPRDGDAETMLIIHTPRYGFRLVVPLTVFMTGNISGLSSSCLRNKKGDVMLQRDMAAIIKLLSARSCASFGTFPCGQLRRELMKVIEASI